MTKGKKIAIIVVSAIVCAIIISIVTLAIVQSTFYSPALNNVKSLNIYVDGTPISIGECVNKEYFNLPEESKSRQYFDGAALRWRPSAAIRFWFAPFPAVLRERGISKGS